MSRFDFDLENDKYEGVLLNLGVLARLTDNKRITVHRQVINIDTDGKLQFAFRFWNKDKRETCLDFVREVVNVAVRMARSSLNDMLRLGGAQDRQSVQEYKIAARRFGRLAQALEYARHGIETQKVTYKSDERFCSKVDVLVGNISDWLQEMQEALVADGATVEQQQQQPPPPESKQEVYVDDYDDE